MRNNIRIMRKPAALAALFPTIRGDVLAAVFAQPDRWWYLSELAEFLGTAPSSLQRELKALVEGGILQQRREGTRVYYKAENRSPLFPELRRLIEKTAGVLPMLRSALMPFQERIGCAFVYGSLARGREHALSDIDVMAIGTIGLADLAPALHDLEARLRREINVTNYSVAEFRKKVSAKDHFVTEVLRGPKQFVKGDQHDLDAIVDRSRRSTSSDLEART